MKVLEFLMKALFKPTDMLHALFFVVFWSVVAELITHAVTGYGLAELIFIEKMNLNSGWATFMTITVLIGLIILVGFTGGKLFKKKQ